MFLLLAVTAAVSSAAPLAVQPTDPAVVARFVENMRDNITLGTLPDGTHLKTETPAERAQPILPVALTQRIFDRGLLTGAIEACGGEGEKASLQPLLDGLRAKGDLSPKQLGFARLLHDAARVQGHNLGDDDCTPEAKTALLDLLGAARRQD